MNRGHQTHRVATVGPVTVEQCDCGVLYVTVGMLTMRLQPDTARTLSVAIDRALAVCETPVIPLPSAAFSD